MFPEVVLQGEFDQRVGQKVGVLGDTADTLCLLNQGFGESPAHRPLLGAEQSALPGGLKDKRPLVTAV